MVSGQMTKIASHAGRLAALMALVGAALYGCTSIGDAGSRPSAAIFTPGVPFPTDAQLAVGGDAPGYDHGARFYTYTSSLPPDAVLANYRGQLEASGFALVRHDGAWYVFTKDGVEVGVQVPIDGPPSTLIVRIGPDQFRAGASGTPNGSPDAAAGNPSTSGASADVTSAASSGASPSGRGQTPDPSAPSASHGNGNGNGGNGGSNAGNGGSNTGNGGSNGGNGGSNTGNGNGSGSSNGGNGNGNGNANGGNGNGTGNGGAATPTPPPKPDPPHGKPSSSPKPSAGPKDKGKP